MEDSGQYSSKEYRHRKKYPSLSLNNGKAQCPIGTQHLFGYLCFSDEVGQAGGWPDDEWSHCPKLVLRRWSDDISRSLHHRSLHRRLLAVEDADAHLWMQSKHAEDT